MPVRSTREQIPGSSLKFDRSIIPKNRHESFNNRNAHPFSSFSCTSLIRIGAYNGIPGPYPVPYDNVADPKNTACRTPLKRRYKSPVFCPVLDFRSK